MLVAFDKYGTVIKQLTHGTPARQGVDGTFEIYFYFKDKNYNNNNYATVSFAYPNGTANNVNYVLTYVENYPFSREENDDVNTYPFMEGMHYPVFKYTATAGTFSQYGEYQATVKVHTGSSQSTVDIQGLLKIPVAKSANPGGTTITVDEYDELINMILTMDGVFVNTIDVSKHKAGDYIILKSTGDVYEIIEDATTKVKSAVKRFELVKFDDNGNRIYYTRSEVDTILSNYVTKNTEQTISGAKTFTGGVKIGPYAYLTGTNFDFSFWDGTEGEFYIPPSAKLFLENSDGDYCYYHLLSPTTEGTYNITFPAQSGTLATVSDATYTSGTGIDVTNKVISVNSTYLNNTYEAKDATILKQANVVDNLTTTSTIYPLSASQGKVLKDQLDMIGSFGRFISLWSGDSGTAVTNPPSSPFAYINGDYFRVGTAGNRVPTGTQYVIGGTNYTTGDTVVGDVWIYDGANEVWVKQSASSFSNYTELTNKPQINNVELLGNKTLSDLGIQSTIDSSNKLNADNVDDLSSTNKFVTSAEKTTWNGKVDGPAGTTLVNNVATFSDTTGNAIGTSDLFVTHGEEQTSPTTISSARNKIKVEGSNGIEINSNQDKILLTASNGIGIQTSGNNANTILTGSNTSQSDITINLPSTSGTLALNIALIDYTLEY